MNLDFNNKIFTLKHLSKEDNLEDFSAKKGYGLEYYLKNNAWEEENLGLCRE